MPLVAAHLVFGAELYRDSLSRALAGEAGLPDSSQSVAELRAFWAIARIR
jgi:hypothetical protein